MKFGLKINSKYKKTTEIAMAVSLILMLAILLGLFLYCRYISHITFEQVVTPDMFGKENNGLIIECVTPDNKTWENSDDVSEYGFGAQYDFWITNNTDHNITDLTGEVVIGVDGELDSYWNFEGEIKDRILYYTITAENLMVIEKGNRESFGITYFSQEYVIPEVIILRGRYDARMIEYNLLKVVITLLVVWIGFLIAYFVFRMEKTKMMETDYENVTIIRGLASMYSTVLIIDLIRDVITPYSINPKVKDMVLEIIERGYDESFELFTEGNSVTSEGEDFAGIRTIGDLRRNLEENRSLVYRFIAVYGDTQQYLEAVYTLLEDKTLCALMVRNVDGEMRRELEYHEQLRAAADEANRANKSKSLFLSRMSHEIRTPMNAIIGMADIIAQGELSDKQREYLEVIEKSGLSLLNIINEVLDLSKIEAGKMELNEATYNPYNLMHDLKLLLDTRVKDKEVVVITEIDDTIPKYLHGDELKLKQILINLANNSIKFTEQGHVKITLKTVEMKADEVKIRVSVADTGQGIKEEDLGKLFSVFSQVDQKKNRNIEGSGLGLAISAQLAELMGGHIEVKSQYGKGSEFYLEIVQRIAKAEEIAEETIETFTAPKAKVLVVDDNKINLMVAKGLMGAYKMQVETAESGSEAIERLINNKEKYDIIFMDLMMPGMDGIATTRIITDSREHGDQTPIIALSADSDAEQLKLAMDAGMSGYLSKPIINNSLKISLKRWLPEEYIEMQ